MGFRRGLRELKGKIGQCFHGQNGAIEDGRGGAVEDGPDSGGRATEPAWTSRPDAREKRDERGVDFQVPLGEIDGHSASSQAEPDGEPPNLRADFGHSSLGPDLAPRATATATNSFGSTGARGGPTASFGGCSTATDYDNLTSPGAQAELNPDYVRQVHIAGGLPWRAPATSSFGSACGARGAGPIASFGACSISTDYDDLTSPGAQAELNPDYVRQVHMSMSLQYAMPVPELGPPPGVPAPAYCGAAAPAWSNFSASSALPPGGFSVTTLPGEQAAYVAEQQAAAHYQLAAEYLRVAAAHRASASVGVGGAPAQAPPQAVPVEVPGLGLGLNTRDFWMPSVGAPWQPPARAAPPAARGLACPAARGVRTGAPAAVDESQRTTVMLRNLPIDYSRKMLVELLDSEGFGAHYNFIYLPIDFKHKAGLGYAFVNMETHEDAKHMWSHFRGFSSWRLTCRKICEVAWGEPLQGLAQHIDRYRNSPVMHKDVPDEYKPLFFIRGVRSPFPPPTRRLKPPRVKCGGSADGHAEEANEGYDGGGQARPSRGPR